jgi:hypothetical protein
MKTIATLLLLLCTGLSEAAISKHSNSLGTISYEVNPYTYEVGSVVTGFDIDDGKGLVLRIQPLGTYALFTDDLLFCGNPVDRLAGKHNPLAITYETVAHRTVRSVGCHELIRADELKDNKVKQ